MVKSCREMSPPVPIMIAGYSQLLVAGLGALTDGGGQALVKWIKERTPGLGTAPGAGYRLYHGRTQYRAAGAGISKL